MTTKNQKHTVKVSDEAYQALHEVAEQRFGNVDAVTWSGLIYELCRETTHENYDLENGAHPEMGQATCTDES